MSEETLFELVRNTPLAERGALLDRECAGRPELRARVEALLKADADLGPIKTVPDETADTIGYESVALPLPWGVKGKIIAGKYTLKEQIGVGGMGAVYLAEQFTPVKRKVAIKLIKPGLDSKSVLARFEAERQALALMDHPNIARVLDGGLTEDRSPFFVMEYIQGSSLIKFCDDARLSIEDRLKLFLPICQAVQHAHQKGIIHRDLKPGNILVTVYDGRPTPKVIDFGVAKAMGAKLTEEMQSTQLGSVIGTLEYMAPEQAGAKSQDIDTRADVYSLGVILYELLTGLRPFDSRKLKEAAILEMIRIVQQEEPSKPSTRLSTEESLPSLASVRHTEPRRLTAMLRGELDWIIMKCLEKHRDRRYDTPSSLCRDIERYLANEMVEARPPSLTYRVRKFVRRNLVMVTAAGLLFLALLGGVLGTSWGMLRAEEQRKDAEKARTLEAQRAVTETAAKEQAEKRLRQVEKGFEILGSIFVNLDPKEIAKAERPLQAILVEQIHQAASRLQPDSIDDPLVVAHAQNLLGRSLIGLAEPAKAIPLLEGSLKARREKLGPGHVDAVEAAGNLATARLDAGQREPAYALMKETLTLAEKHLGLDHVVTLKARNNLGSAYLEAGKFDQAEVYFKETWEQRKRILGAEHDLTLTSMNNLAMAYQAGGKHNLAMPLLEESLRLSRTHRGLEHPETLAAMNNLGMGLFFTGKREEAVAIFEECLAGRRNKLGPEHMDTLGSMNNLASVYRTLGKAGLAVPLLEEVVSRLRAKWGPDHPRSLTASNNLGSCYDLAGKGEEAVSIYREVLQRRKAKLGSEHPDTLSTLNNLGIALLKQKNWAEAEASLRENFTIRSRKEPGAWATCNVQCLLGEALLGQKKYAEAEPMLLAGIEGMKLRAKETPAAMRNRMGQVIDCVIRLYSETNKADEQKKWQAEKARLPQGEGRP